MIKVYIRHEDENMALLLGEFSPREISDLVNLAKSYPCFSEVGTLNFLSVQFVALPSYKSEAFFEILFGKEE